MPSAYVPSATTDRVYIGSTTIPNPIMFLSIGGIVYSNGYTETSGTNSRTIFPVCDSNGSVYLVSNNIVYGADMPSITINNVEVFIVG